MVTITISTLIFPTEDLSKVKQAINNFFPEIDLKINTNKITFESTDDSILQHLLWKQQDQKILDSVRKVLVSSLSTNSATLHIHKQLAFVNYLNVCENSESSPLGSIKLIISASTNEELMEVIDKYFPKFEWIKDG